MATKHRSSALLAAAAPIQAHRRGPSVPHRDPTRPRGRPSKFGRPGHVVALTLPDDTIHALQRVDPDLGWAIVKLLDQEARRPLRRAAPQPDVELVSVGARWSLIVINRAAIKSLPGVNILPLTDSRAFLALEPGRGMSDLELAAIDRLDDEGVTARERRALIKLRNQLTAWRRNHALQFHVRAVIVVERLARRGPAVVRGRRG